MPHYHPTPPSFTLRCFKWLTFIGAFMVLMWWATPTHALNNQTIIEHVEIIGNQHIATDTITPHANLDLPKPLSAIDTKALIDKLYRTQFFRDVQLHVHEQTLVIHVLERAAIDQILIDGNELIATEQLTTILDEMGIKKGKLFQPFKIDRVSLGLKQRYHNEAYYGAKVTMTTEPSTHNRVNVRVHIIEGEAAHIDRINIVGNQMFTDARLLAQLQLQEPSANSAYSGNDQYSAFKFEADQHTLTDYYMNHGYAKFELNSAQVSISGDKRYVYLTYHIHEGDFYRFGDIDISGDLPVDKAQLMQVLTATPGDTFSKKDIIHSINNLRNRLSEDGYAYSEITPKQHIDEKSKRIHFNFVVQPKNRVYVRHVIIEGNVATSDHVVRREIRQLEGAPYSLSTIATSKGRLQRLGFFQNIQFETKRLASDMVDIVVKLQERNTGSFQAGVGYSQTYGTSFKLSLSEKNTFGTGNATNISIDTSESKDDFNVSLTQPYITQNGHSLTEGLFYSRLDTSQLGISNYAINKLGGRLNYGIPYSENLRFNMGYRYMESDLTCDTGFVTCTNFQITHGDANVSNSLSLGLSHDTRNDIYFPSDGHRYTLTLDSTLPSDDLTFYTLEMDEKLYFPLDDDKLALGFNLNLAYGTGYGEQSSLPFYERYYLGGITSIRGYATGTLGEHYNLDTDGVSTAKGGDAKAKATLALIAPMPGSETSENMRVSLFIDAGQLYPDVNRMDFSDWIATAGFGMNWITPIGPLMFSWAYPITPVPTDAVEQAFQFSVGTPF